MNVTKGLIIDDPWIGYILDGTKTWEMRSTSASHLGWFALIRKGTGAVWGVAQLVESGSPLSVDDMIATIDRHRIPAEMIRTGQVAKWTTPWKLADVRKLASPVPYRHKSGAVTWVELDERASAELARQLGSVPSEGKPEPASRTDPAPGILQGALNALTPKSTAPAAACRRPARRLAVDALCLCRQQGPTAPACR